MGDRRMIKISYQRIAEMFRIVLGNGNCNRTLGVFNNRVGIPVIPDELNDP